MRASVILDENIIYKVLFLNDIQEKNYKKKPT